MLHISWEKHIYIAILLFLGSCLFSPTPSSEAHIEKGPMPDDIAEIEYQILLEFEPQNIEARTNLGMIYLRKNKLDEAEKELFEVLRIAPDSFDALDTMGLLRAAHNDHEGAVAFFEAAIAIRPEDVMVHYHLGQSLAASGRFTEAENEFITALMKNEHGASPGNAASNEEKIKDALNNVRARENRSQ